MLRSSAFSISAASSSLSTLSPSSLLTNNPLTALHASMGTIVTSEITPRVLIADWLVAQNWDALNAMGVTHVVSVCEIPPIVSSKIAHMHVCIVDLPIADISEHFEKTTAFIQGALSKEGTRVLVHCLGGLSRSVSVVCAYLIAAKGLTAAEAIAYTKDRRRVAHPNIGFRYQLRRWAERHGHPDSQDDGLEHSDEEQDTSIAGAALSRLGLSSHGQLPKLPGAGLLQHGTVRKMVSDSIGKLAGHGGNETEILTVARAKALGPDWTATATVVTHASVNQDNSVNVEVAVAQTGVETVA